MINQVTIVGRLTKDVDLKLTATGKAVANVTLAVPQNFSDKTTGEAKTDFIPCVLWNKQAENTAKYCEKGSVIGVVGRISTRSYDNAESKKVYVTEVICEGVHFLNFKKSDGGEATSPVSDRTPPPITGHESDYFNPALHMSDDSFDEDDLPF